jgi:hypothetical protein
MPRQRAFRYDPQKPQSEYYSAGALSFLMFIMPSTYFS